MSSYYPPLYVTPSFPVASQDSITTVELNDDDDDDEDDISEEGSFIMDDESDGMATQPARFILFPNDQGNFVFCFFCKHTHTHKQI